MTTADDKDEALDALARGFADKLTSLTRGLLGEDTPRFHALNMGRRFQVAPITDGKIVQRIPIKIDGTDRLQLYACYFCCWDGSSTFLATDKAEVHVFYPKVTDPLIRYEYVRKSEEPPGAHIHVHAHRDEMAYLLRLAESGRPKRQMRSDRLPRLAEMHFPVGGHRMRPALEDVLMLLQREFSIDTVPEWKEVLDAHLQEWRLMQLKSAVRDAPEAAADALRMMGYSVAPPAIGGQRVPDDAVKLYWP